MAENSLQIQSEVGCLTLTEKKAISELPENLKKYILAKESEVISNKKRGDAIISIYDVLYKTLVNVGYNNIATQKDTVELIAVSVYDLIIARYKTITIDEFKIACFNGSIKDYGDYMGVNLKTISDWLKGYLNDENKKKAMAEFNRLLDLVQIRVYTDAQKEQIILEGCVHFFNEYKKLGILNEIQKPANNLMAIFYDKLKDIGLIVFTKERRVELFKKSEKEYVYQLEHAKNSKKVNFDQAGFDLMVSLMAKNENEPFKNLCKRNALIEYFNDLILTDENLQELINEKTKK